MVQASLNFLLLGLVSLYPLLDAVRLHRSTFGTYNANLIRSSPAFGERKALLIDMLQKRLRTGAPDVLCLQELVRRSDARDIVEAVRTQYPYHASLVDLFPPPSLQPACSPSEAAAIGFCVASCLALNDTGAITNCFFVNCNERVLGITNPCFLCVGSEIGAAEDAQLDPITRCASAIPASDYTDSFGILLLSTFRLSDVTTINYHNDSLLPRGYIRAKVNALKYTAFCTHLTPFFPDRDYTGPPEFSSQHEHQASEVQQLITAVEGRSRVILLGDFNHGPATPGLHWEVPTNFGLMAARGLFSVNALFCNQCTYCTDNVLTGGLFPNTIIDHIYLPTSAVSSVVRVERIFDDVTTVSGLPLSDHFGVRALIRTNNVFGRKVKFLPMDDIDFHIDEFCPV